MADTASVAGLVFQDKDTAPGVQKHGPRQLSLSEEDESVMIAVRALDDMRSRPVLPPLASTSYHRQTSPSTTPALSRASTSTSPSLASQILRPIDDITSPDFVSRMSGLPIVNTALRAYENSKASSRVVKYGAEMMESSVKTISRPVIDRLPVNQLDEFACRQLDRLGRYGRPGSDDASQETRGRSTSVERDRQYWEQELYRRLREKTSADSSREPSVAPSEGASAHDELDRLQTQERQDAVARSPWQALLTEAGGIGAAVSDESMRRLQYCLQWLQYATQHIDARILILRDFISSLKMQQRQNRENGEEQVVSASHLETLSDVKRDVVSTIRQVVDVVSKYAGGALPEPARARVRQFILHLPQRCAVSTARPIGTQSPLASRSSSAIASGSGSRSMNGGVLPTVMPYPGQPRSGMRTTTIAATQSAQRILTLASESLDMMRSVTGVFKESLDRAEAWIERFRVIGIQRPPRQEFDPLYQGEEDPRVDENMATSMALSARVFQPPPPDSILATSSSSSSLTGVTASSLGALSLSSNFNTRSSSTTSLYGETDWSFTVGASSRSIMSDARDTRFRDNVTEPTATSLSAARDPVNRPSMDVDQ